MDDKSKDNPYKKVTDNVKVRLRFGLKKSLIGIAIGIVVAILCNVFLPDTDFCRFLKITSAGLTAGFTLGVLSYAVVWKDEDDNDEKDNNDCDNAN